MDIIKISPMDITFPYANEEKGLRPEPKETDSDWDVTLNLLADIREHGMSDLFSVRPLENGKYEVINGSRRAKVCQILHEEENPVYQTIPVQVNNIDEMESLERQVAGNATVHPTSAKQYAAALSKIVIHKGYSLPELAKAVGKSDAFVLNMLRFNRLPDSIKDLVTANKMPVTNAITLTKLPKDINPETLVQDACVLQTAEFALKVNEAIDNYRNEQKAMKGGKEPEFELTGKRISGDQMKINLEKAKNLVQDDPSEFNRGYLKAYQEIFSVDEVTAALRKSDWEQKQAKKKADAEKRKADTETKKKADIAKYVKEHGITDLSQLSA